MKAINKDLLREIRRSKMRFFYICAIIALGVAFFCGIKAVSPSMIKTAVDYFQQYRLSDFRLLSTYGFRDEDIKRLETVDGVEEAQGAYSMDVIMQLGESKSVVKIMSLSDGLTINEPLLIDGNLPTKPDECVIEDPSRHFSVKIGDQIDVLNESHTPEELDHLRTRSFKITGYIKTPQYISIERGNTNISDGSIDAYIMVPPESFNYERYTEAYIYTDVSQNGTDPYSDTYSSAQERMISSLENVGQEILDDNLSDIKSEAMKKISDGEDELNRQEQQFNDKIGAAHREISEQTTKLRNGYAEYENGIKTLNTQIAQAQQVLAQGQRELDQGLAAYYSGRETLIGELSRAEQELNSAREQIFSGYREYDEGQLLFKTQLELGERQIREGWIQIEAGYTQYNQELENFNTMVREAEEEIAAGEAQISQGLLEYQAAKDQIESEFSTAQTQIDQGFSEYEKGLAEYNEALESFNEQIQSAQAQIDSGREELESAQKSYDENYQKFLQGKEAYTKAKEEFDRQLPVIEEQIRTAEGQLGQVNASIAEITPKIAALDSQITPLNQRKAALEKEIANINNSLTQIENSKAAAEKRLQIVKEELEKNPGSESLKSEYASLTQQLENYNSQKNSLEEKLKPLQTELQQINASLDELGSTRSQLQQTLDTLTQQKNTLSSQIQSARAQIDSTQKTLAEQEKTLSQTEASLAEAKAQIEASKKELDTAQNELDSQREAGEKELEAARVQLEETYDQLQTAQTELNTQKNAVLEELDRTFEPLLKAQAELENAKEQLKTQSEAALVELNRALAELNSARDDLLAAQETLEREAANGAAELETAREQLLSAQNTLNQGTALFNQQRQLGLNQLDAAYRTIESGQLELENGRSELFSERDKGLAQLQSALTTLETGERALNQGRSELATQEADGRKQLDEAKDKINDSKAQLENLSRGDWYVYTRDDNPGYSGYQEDAERIDNVGNVFPLFFFLVAALVAFTTMTRMVEEERTQIGTLYALGYSRTQILKKYVYYAGLAALIGATFGWIFGVLVFPILIFWAYNILYQMPDLILSIPWHIVIISYVVSFACTVGAAVIVALSELRSVPAELMRPKAPKPGKRIFLERIPFIWNRLSFISKVSMRNIFRYKARFFMTVVGIAGCMALILAGFGLHDAIFTIVPSQFGVINHYDQSLIVKDTSTDIVGKVEKVIADSRVKDAMPVDQETVNVVTDSGNLSAYLIVPRDPGNFSNFVSLHQRTNRDQPIELDDDGVVVSEKLATNYGAEPGSEIELEIDNKHYKARVSNQTENYLENYVYMSPVLYRKVVGRPPDYSLIYVNLEDSVTEPSEQDAFSADMISSGDYTSAINVSSVVDTANKTMQSLNILVVVMIVSAGMLAFIVLNNLTNINISERIREIATLKVLGFRSKETNNYIFRENIVLSIFGILLGIVLGILLLRFIITTVELDIIMFGREIYPLSYVYSIVLTLGFTIIVNFTMIPVIRRVDMVEALKDID